MSKVLKSFIIFGFILLLVMSLSAQRQTGSIKGTVVDTEGNPLPGVTVSVSGPALLGTLSYITTADGIFRAPSLPPGEYSVKAELTGFQTTIRERVVVHVGMTADIRIEMKMAAIAEEVTVTAASPVVDVESSKVSVTLTSELLRNIPLARNLYDIVNSAPGAISEGVTYRETSSIHGGTVRSNTYALDGVNMNDPVVMYRMTPFNFDVIDEVELETGAHPAEVGLTDGGYINVVTKSGGNSFKGGFTTYYTSEDFSKSMITEPQLTAAGLKTPTFDKINLDLSGTLGGPIFKDRLWFFGNARRIGQKLATPFIPFTDHFGKEHPYYDWEHQETQGFVKFTSQVMENIKFMGLLNIADIYRPVYEYPIGWNTTKEATRVWDHEKGTTINGILTWVINQNTFVEGRFGYVNRWFPIPLQPDSRDNFYWYDRGTGQYGGRARFNETYTRRRVNPLLTFTRYQDNFLGGNHEFKAGFEYEIAYGDWDWWLKNPYNRYYYYGLPWYYHNTTPYMGYFTVYIAGPNQGDNVVKDQLWRMGFYAQDTYTIGERLTLNLGIRYDESHGFKPETMKKGWVDTNYNGLANVLLPDVFRTTDITSPKMSDIIVWKDLSPRVGITYDLFGNGKTALKGSFARYTEYLMLQYISVAHPFYPTTASFYWYDDNKNGKYDLPPTDRYTSIYIPSVIPDQAAIRKKMDPNLKGPYNDEFVLGIQHELFRDFSIGLNFLHKDKKRMAEDIDINNPIGGNMWVPYTTKDPGWDGKFGTADDKDITVYMLKKTAESSLWQFTNVPQGKRKYQALELIFFKRMSNNWQLNGSVVWSKFWGNIGGDYGSSWGYSGAFDSPNWDVNRWGRLDFDRPLVIKLQGTVILPYRVYLSAYYRHEDGGPWGRTVTIYFPKTVSGYAPKYTSVGVMAEAPGERRGQAVDLLDLRVEKEFDLGKYGRIGAYVDIFNVLGWSRWSIDQNPGGYIYADGTFSRYPTYSKILGAEGVRTFKFSLRYSF